MKVPKCVSFDEDLIKFIKTKRPEFHKKFSKRVEALVRADVMDIEESAVEFKVSETAKKISRLTETITGLKLERSILEREMEFLQAESKKEESK